MSMLKPDLDLIRHALKGACPSCHKASLFEGKFSLSIRARCPHCNLDLSEHDCGDGPVVFLHFILGFTLVPLALLVEYWLAPPLWVHGILWLTLSIALTMLAMRPLKSYITALEYKHRGLPK
jgi:uncharacterized protein (DUF983 family)